LTEGLREAEGLKNDGEGPQSDCTASGADTQSVLNAFKKCQYDRLSLRQFAAIAAEESRGASEQSSWPKSVTWEFTRYCRAHPRLTHLTAEQAYEQIDWDAAGFAEEEMMEFFIEWDKVHHLPGVQPVDWALRMAQERTLVPPEPRSKMKAYARFLSLAGWLQVLVGDNPIFLPCRKIGEMLGVSHETVSTMRKLAVRDKMLSRLCVTLPPMRRAFDLRLIVIRSYRRDRSSNQRRKLERAGIFRNLAKRDEPTQSSQLGWRSGICHIES
jgi:hypothetical protein